MKQSEFDEKKQRIVELKANENRQPAEDQELAELEREVSLAVIDKEPEAEKPKQKIKPKQ